MVRYDGLVFLGHSHMTGIVIKGGRYICFELQMPGIGLFSGAAKPFFNQTKFIRDGQVVPGKVISSSLQGITVMQIPDWFDRKKSVCL
jgi:hypothetical protein